MRKYFCTRWTVSDEAFLRPKRQLNIFITEIWTNIFYELKDFIIDFTPFMKILLKIKTESKISSFSPVFFCIEIAFKFISNNNDIKKENE